VHIRSLLSLAASAATLLVPAVPAHAAADGVYLIRDAASGRCVAPADGPVGGPLQACGPGNRWELRAAGDRTVRFAALDGQGRCLALSPAFVSPAALRLSPCGTAPDVWRVIGPRAPEVDAVELADAPGNALVPAGDRVTLANGLRFQWILQKVG
jgi:hypothetical protein